MPGGADYSSCLVRHNLAVIRRAAVVWLFCTLASVRIMLVLYLFRRTDNLVGRDFQRLCIHVDFNAVDGEAGVYVPVHAVEVGGIAVGAAAQQCDMLAKFSEVHSDLTADQPGTQNDEAVDVREVPVEHFPAGLRTVVASAPSRRGMVHSEPVAAIILAYLPVLAVSRVNSVLSWISTPSLLTVWMRYSVYFL